MGKTVRVSTYSSKLSPTTAKITTLETQPEVLFEVALGALPQITLQLPRLVLLQHEDVLAGRELLFPGLDFFLAGECVGLEDPVDDGSQLGVGLVELGRAFEALDGGMVVVAIGFGLGGDGQFGHLLGRLVLDDMFPCAADVESQRVASCDVVELGVSSEAGAAAVEALEADVKSGEVVLLSSKEVREEVMGCQAARDG